MSSNDYMIKFLDELSYIGIEKDMRFYYVGGCVRDAFFGVPIADIDIALDGDIDELFECLSRAYDVKKSKFDTISLTFEGVHLDIAGFRREIYHDFSGLPHVTRGSLETDLSRRDFTINTGYVPLDPITTQSLLSGRTLSKAMVYASHDSFFEDLEARRLRTLKDGSFSEDATRMLRAVKYLVIHRLTFDIETKRQFEMGIHERWVDRCSEDRYKRILLALASHECWKPLLITASEYRLFQRNALFSGNQAYELLEHLEAVRKKIDGFDMSIVFLLAVYERNLSYWTSAPKGISVHAKQCREIMERMENNMDLLACHGLFKGASRETIAFFHICTACNETVKRFVTDDLWKIDVIIRGKDLIELGIEEGITVGKVMRALLKHALESGHQLSKLEELEWVESKINEYRD